MLQSSCSDSQISMRNVTDVIVLSIVVVLGRPERFLSFADCVALKRCNSLDIVLWATPNTAATCWEDCPALSIPTAWLLSLVLSEGLLPIFNSIAYASAVKAVKRLQPYMYTPWVLGRAYMKEKSVCKFGQKISCRLKMIPKICVFSVHFTHFLGKWTMWSNVELMRGFRYTINVWFYLV